MIPVVLNEGRKTIFMVDGRKKKDIIQALRDELAVIESRYLPVSRIQPGGRSFVATGRGGGKLKMIQHLS